MTAQPIVLLGLALLAAGIMRLPLVLRLLLPAGLALDYLLAIHLHVHLQSYIFRVVQSASGSTIHLTSRLGYVALHNFLMYDNGLVFLGDHLASWWPVFETVMALTALTVIRVRRQKR